MNYDETFQHIRKHIDQSEWPVRFSQYDSWFYPHGVGNDVKEWDFLTDPKNFPRGGEAAYIDHHLPLVAHNRWFGPGRSHDTILKLQKNFQTRSMRKKMAVITTSLSRTTQ